MKTAGLGKTLMKKKISKLFYVTHSESLKKKYTHIYTYTHTYIV